MDRGRRDLCRHAGRGRIRQGCAPTSTAPSFRNSGGPPSTARTTSPYSPFSDPLILLRGIRAFVDGLVGLRRGASLLDRNVARCRSVAGESTALSSSSATPYFSNARWRLMICSLSPWRRGPAALERVAVATTAATPAEERRPRPHRKRAHRSSLERRRRRRPRVACAPSRPRPAPRAKGRVDRAVAQVHAPRSRRRGRSSTYGGRRTAQPSRSLGVGARCAAHDLIGKRSSSSSTRSRARRRRPRRRGQPPSAAGRPARR